MSHDRLPESLDIDRASAAEIVRIINDQDAVVAGAVRGAADRMAQAIEAIADRLRDGGRLFYAGAGTSGRIAMLDASELPPTYGVDPDLVQVIIAGGEAAFFRAVEGAEDDDEAAIREVAERVRPQDCLVGIAASGATPFTVAAVRRANMQGALTVGVTSIPGSPLARECDIPIVTPTGAEVILGSTRMKAGTAQKLVLNTLSTGVMILTGRVYSNLMVEMPPTNAKLRSRAVLMVELAAGVPRPRAHQLYEEAGREAKTAIVMALKNVDPGEARSRLQQSNGNLREALER